VVKTIGEMNKKQLIVAWGVVILEVLVFSLWWNNVKLYNLKWYLNLKLISPTAIAILITGGFLIYTFKREEGIGIKKIIVRASSIILIVFAGFFGWGARIFTIKNTSDAWLYILFYICILYLLIRFIIWAIRTLKKKPAPK
jgi:hypothetical protein